MKKRIICIVFFLFIGEIVTGCSKNNSNNTNQEQQVASSQEEEKPMELTERQKEILQKEGITTQVEQLTDKQRNGIIAIEEFFEYLDKYYPEEEFVYDTYYMPSDNPVDGAERLNVYRKDDPEKTIMGIERWWSDGEWQYIDEYEEMMGETFLMRISKYF